ncbi:erythromycin esterase family protein [Streptomyces netropsis]|uniref:erythromycin esterase family protein n=1 Tax=Streptomyces netropsis TaxID=55404 RepID=UPI0030D19164
MGSQQRLSPCPRGRPHGGARGPPRHRPRLRPGSFLSRGEALGGEWKKFTVAPAGPGANEHTLDQGRRRDSCVDLRKAPAVARSWPDASRPTSGVGTQCPNGKKPEIAIDRAYDVLVHRHAVREAGKL